MREVFGFQVPIENYYPAPGPCLGGCLRATVGYGLDWMTSLRSSWARRSEVRLPEIGKVYYQDHLCLALFRQGQKGFL